MADRLEVPLPLNTAILFLIFNRPDTTRRVFEAIRKAQPPRLYVAGDGPRKEHRNESERVFTARSIATEVNWPCELRTLFRDTNKGCKAAVSEAITWFFDYEEQGIILEDDCLPHPDFFYFSEALLSKYRDDLRVSAITGNNFQNEIKRGDGSYYFSKYSHCWGWASWRRAWQCYRGDLNFWPTWSRSAEWSFMTPDPVERRYWERIFRRVQAEEIDSWAYAWMACLWFQGGLTATPNVNLVSNIGFGQGSTHTSASDSPLSDMFTGAIGSLAHPRDVERDVGADRYVFKNVIFGKYERFPYRLIAILIRLFRRLRRALEPKVA